MIDLSLNAGNITLVKLVDVRSVLWRTSCLGLTDVVSIYNLHNFRPIIVVFVQQRSKFVIEEIWFRCIMRNFVTLQSDVNLGRQDSKWRKPWSCKINPIYAILFKHFESWGFTSFPVLQRCKCVLSVHHWVIYWMISFVSYPLSDPCLDDG
jgi:hypothetical protein